jgi:hypothetical protein
MHWHFTSSQQRIESKKGGDAPYFHSDRGVERNDRQQRHLVYRGKWFNNDNNEARKECQCSGDGIWTTWAYISGQHCLSAGDGQPMTTVLEGKQVDNTEEIGEIETRVVYGMEQPWFPGASLLVFVTAGLDGGKKTVG